MAMLCILDEGDEVLIPEPYYPNYFTFIRMAGGRVHPIPTSPEDGYRYAERARIEPHITEKTRATSLQTPGQPTRHGAHPGGAAPHGGYRPRARPVSHLRRGLPRVHL